MLTKPLTAEEDYQLDIAGYITIPNVLSPTELSVCHDALDAVGDTEGMLNWKTPYCDPFVALCEHPVLHRYLEQICFEKVRVNQTPRLLQTILPYQPMVGGNEPRNWSRSYFQAEQTRFVQGVIAVWALDTIARGDGGFTLIPGSHKSQVKTPIDILDGSDDMDLSEQPSLNAGDLLLCTETLLHAMRPWRTQTPPRLLAFGYIGSLVRRSNDAPAQEDDRSDPDWTPEMTQEQRVILGVDRPNPGPIVNSDGRKTWVEVGSGTHHPSILMKNPKSGIDEKEFYHWDLCGHLVLRGIMDSTWLHDANKAIDTWMETAERGDPSTTGTWSVHGLFEFEAPHCDPFRRMIAHPAVVQRLNWMSGSGFVLDAARAIIYEKGSPAHRLHSGPVPGSPRSPYLMQNGRTYCETINITWALVDQNPGDGGFVAVPGSHKCRLPMPECMRDMENELGLVRHVRLKAGDVVLFMGSAQIHGAYAWNNHRPRRAVILNFVSRSLDQPPRRF